MVPSNAALLTRQSTAWAHKKRARQGQVKEIVFDEEARREYLTGFRKRNAERKKVAKAKAAEREKQEHLEERRQMRKELKERAQTNFEAVEKAYGGAALEFAGISSTSKPDEHEEEYSDEEQLATVAVIEDFDPTTDLLGPQPVWGQGKECDEPEEGPSIKKFKLTTTDKKSKSKPHKIRYETKAAARAAHVKALSQRRKQKDKRPIVKHLTSPVGLVDYLNTGPGAYNAHALDVNAFGFTGTSHYEMFLELSKKQLKLHNVVSNPNTQRLAGRETLQPVMLAFDAAFSYLIWSIEMVWVYTGPEAKALKGNVKTLMFKIMKPIAQFLVKQKLDSMKKNAAPPFNFYLFEEGSSPRKDLRKALQTAADTAKDYPGGESLKGLPELADGLLDLGDV